jgi:predicted Zn-dependent protease
LNEFGLRERFRVLCGALVAVLLLAAAPAFAAEYGQYDPKRILIKADKKAGAGPGVDLRYLDQMLQDLGSHARNYPPKFDTEADRKRAAKDAATLSRMLDVVVRPADADAEVLLRAAILNGIAHNLKVPGTADKAQDIYTTLLARAPDHARTNQQYGMFLAGTARFKESIPPLEKALAGGLPQANYSLGLVYLSMENVPKAIAHLEAYAAHFPGDANATKLLAAARSGKLKVRRSDK